MAENTLILCSRWRNKKKKTFKYVANSRLVMIVPGAYMSTSSLKTLYTFH